MIVSPFMAPFWAVLTWLRNDAHRGNRIGVGANQIGDGATVGSPFVWCCNGRVNFQTKNVEYIYSV